MSRNIELERILQGWFEWEHCPGDKKDERRRALHKLLDERSAPAQMFRGRNSSSRSPSATASSGQ